MLTPLLLLWQTVEEKAKKERNRLALGEKRKELANKLRARAEERRTERIATKGRQIEAMQHLLSMVRGVAQAPARSSTTSPASSTRALDDADDLMLDIEEGTGDLALPREEGDRDRYLEQLHYLGYADEDDLEETIESEQKTLDRWMGVEVVKEAPDYSLLAIPDGDLTAAQIKEKRKQRLLKCASDARIRIADEKEEAARIAAQKQAVLEQRRIADFEGWRQDLYTERSVGQEATKVITLHASLPSDTHCLPLPLPLRNRN